MLLYNLLHCCMLLYNLPHCYIWYTTGFTVVYNLVLQGYIVFYNLRVRPEISPWDLPGYLSPLRYLTPNNPATHAAIQRLDWRVLLGSYENSDILLGQS